MGYFVNIVRQASRVGVAIGAVFLTAMMMITIANIVFRFFGRGIGGTYELTEQMMMVICGGFALVYTALRKRNIVVTILFQRFTNRVQAILEALYSIMGIGLTGLMAWVTIDYMLGRGFEQAGLTLLLGVPLFPIKCVWAIALSLVALVFVVDLYEALSRVVAK
jgi:TRAP-type C4-dicarboxylate transport system permease small subunit